MQFPPPDPNLELNKLYSEAIKSEFTNNLNILNRDIIGRQLKAILSMNQDSLFQLHHLLNICERSRHSEQFLNYNISKFVKLQDIQSQSYLIIHSSAKPHDKYNFLLKVGQILLSELNELILTYGNRINLQEIYDEVIL